MYSGDQITKIFNKRIHLNNWLMFTQFTIVMPNTVVWFMAYLRIFWSIFWAIFFKLVHCIGFWMVWPISWPKASEYYWTCIPTLDNFSPITRTLFEKQTANQTCFDHLNTGLFRYLDPHCTICFIRLVILWLNNYFGFRSGPEDCRSQRRQLVPDPWAASQVRASGNYGNRDGRATAKNGAFYDRLLWSRCDNLLANWAIR